VLCASPKIGDWDVRGAVSAEPLEVVTKGVGYELHRRDLVVVVERDIDDRVLCRRSPSTQVPAVAVTVVPMVQHHEVGWQAGLVELAIHVEDVKGLAVVLADTGEPGAVDGACGCDLGEQGRDWDTEFAGHAIETGRGGRLGTERPPSRASAAKEFDEHLVGNHGSLHVGRVWNYLLAAHGR